MSTRAVASRLGTSARPIYYFFASMIELDRELVKKGVDLLHGYMTKIFTDDPWHNHGIGYVRFAMTEKHLFSGMTDGRRVDWFKKYGDVIWENLTQSLKEYPPFQEFSQEEIYQVQLTRWLFAHGLAFQACNPPEGVWTKELFDSMMPGVNGAIVSRIRFIDEVVEQCLSSGFSQMVIIGAGYDTRPYRIDGVSEKLMENGFQKKLKTLFIAEGLLMYIPPQAVDSLLAFVTASSKDSLFVADYFPSDVIDGTSPLKEARVLRQFVKNEGSDLLFGIEEGTALDFFVNRGFYNINLVPAPSLKKAYFRGESTKRQVSPMFNFVKAFVAP